MQQRHGTITEVTVGDGAGRMKLVFFNHRHSAAEASARWGLFAGTVGKYQGELQFTHPDMHLLSGDDDDDDWARALVPIYPASKDVSSWVIQKSVKLLLGRLGRLRRARRGPAARGDARPARAAVAGRRPARHPPPHHGRGRRARPTTG